MFTAQSTASERSIVNIIDFESVDFSEDGSLQPLTNNQDMLIKEIESQDEESGIEDLCDIDRNLIREGVGSLTGAEELKRYCMKICEYYSEKVGILMRHIFRASNSDASLAKLLRERDQRIAKLQKDLEDTRMFENRLKELEIENTQLKKFKGRFEESETKSRNLEKKIGFYRDLVDGKDEVVGIFSLEDVNMWENKAMHLLAKLKDRKSDLCQELMGRAAALPKCVVCQVKPVATIIKDCNHICLCCDCSLTVDKCPFDRKKILAVEKVFLP